MNSLFMDKLVKTVLGKNSSSAVLWDRNWLMYKLTVYQPADTGTVPRLMQTP